MRCSACQVLIFHLYTRYHKANFSSAICLLLSFDNRCEDLFSLSQLNKSTASSGHMSGLFCLNMSFDALFHHLSTWRNTNCLRHNQLARRSGASGGLRKNGAPVRMEDFERKLTETDCYLQMLIDQNQTLVEQLESEKDEDGEDCKVVVERVNDMVETVKHAIVLLQIAKNASCPEDGEVVAAVQRADVDNGSVGEEVVEEEGNDNLSVNSRDPQASPSPKMRTEAQKQLSATLKNPSTIPAVSYSSSDDDEDDFYDAQDDVSRGGASATSEPPTLAEAAETVDVSPLTPR